MLKYFNNSGFKSFTSPLALAVSIGLILSSLPLYASDSLKEDYAPVDVPNISTLGKRSREEAKSSEIHKKAKGKQKLIESHSDEEEKELSESEEESTPHSKYYSSMNMEQLAEVANYNDTDDKRINKSIELNSEYLGLPAELINKILKFLDVKSLVNHRLVCTQLKASVDDKSLIYYLSLQKIRLLKNFPKNLISTLYLKGWTPTFEEVFSSLAYKNIRLEGKIFISNLDNTNVNFPEGLNITLTVPNKRLAELKILELERLGIKNIIVHSREALWNTFINEPSIANCPYRNLIVDNQHVLLPLFDVDGSGDFVRNIIQMLLIEEEQEWELSNAYAPPIFTMGIKNLAEIPESLRIKLASFLNEEILSRCKNSLGGTFRAFSMIKNEELFKRYSRFILKTIDKYKDGYDIAQVIEYLVNIKETEKLEFIIDKFLNDKIINVLQNGDQFEELISSLVGIKDIRKLKFLMSGLLNSRIPSLCEDGDQLANIIRAFINIQDQNTLKEVFILLAENYTKWPNANYMAGSISALASIDKAERTHMVSLLNQRIFSGCLNANIAKAIVLALAKINSHKLRTHIASLLTQEVLSNCRNEDVATGLIDGLGICKDLDNCTKVILCLDKSALYKCRKGFHSSLMVAKYLANMSS